jgi:hypothetical protein
MQAGTNRALLAIAVLATPSAFAQDPLVQPEVFPPEFRGMIVYDGVVNGTAVIPPQGRMELSLGGLLNQALNTRTVKLTGTWHVEAEYEGSTVKGRSIVDSSIDGLSENVEFVGTRQGNNCQISFAGQPALSITCSPFLFESNMKYTNENGQRIKARYLASKSKIIDYVERDRLLALAAAQEEENAKRAAANGKILRTSTMTTAGVVKGDTEVPVRELKGLKKITVSVKNADDIGQFFVFDSKEKVHSVAWAEWNSQQGAGSSVGDATKFLLRGRNALVFFIHNKQFQFGAGKWSFDAKVLGDGKPVWTASGGTPGGSVGIQFWKAIFVDKAANGTLSIVAPSSKKMEDAIPMMKIVNAQLIRDHGTEQSATGTIAGGIIDSMIRSMIGFGSSDSSGNKNKKEFVCVPVYNGSTYVRQDCEYQ